MPEYTFQKYLSKFNPFLERSLTDGMAKAQVNGHEATSLAHWLFEILSEKESDISLSLAHQDLNRGQVLHELNQYLEGRPIVSAPDPALHQNLIDAGKNAWDVCSLHFSESTIRSGHVLLGALDDLKLNPILGRYSRELGKLSTDLLLSAGTKAWEGSVETPTPIELAVPNTPKGAGPSLADPKSRSEERRVRKKSRSR